MTNAPEILRPASYVYGQWHANPEGQTLLDAVQAVGSHQIDAPGLAPAGGNTELLSRTTFRPGVPERQHQAQPCLIEVLEGQFAVQRPLFSVSMDA